MDFKEICSVFGGTIFYDDFRGNFEEIRNELDHRQAQASIPLLDNAATLLLLRGVWNLLTGNLQEASQLLECLTEGGVYGERWKLRAHAYTGILYTWSEHPPLLNFCELSGPAMVTWKNRFPENRTLDALSYCDKHLRDGSDLDIAEFRIIFEVCLVHNVIRKLAHRLNPASEDYEDNAAARDTLSRHVSASKSRLVDFGRVTLHLGLPAVAAYLSKLLYEITRTEGSPTAYVHLERMKACYVRKEDETGIGLYWLLRGDHNVSPPTTSLLVLNFDIVDSPDEFGGDSRLFHSTEMYPLNLEDDFVSDTLVADSDKLSTPHLRELSCKLAL
jgi:hypothetical protein